MAFDAGQYKKVEREVYSKTVASYEKYGGETFQAYAQRLLDGSCELKPGQHVLDVACGPGIPFPHGRSTVSNANQLRPAAVDDVPRLEVGAEGLEMPFAIEAAEAVYGLAVDTFGDG